MNTMSDTQKAKLGAKYIDGSTVITETDNGTKYKVNDITETALVICKCNKVKGEEPFEMPFTELTDKFDKNEINISGYEHSEPDSVLLHQVVRDIMAGKALAKKDDQIAELETEEVTFKQGGVAGTIKIAKNGYVREIKNQFGKKIDRVRSGDMDFKWNPEDKTYKSTTTATRLNRNSINDLQILKDGGGIKNQYEGKTDQQVWDDWTEQQRIQFLLDHANKFERFNVDVDSWNWKKFGRGDTPTFENVAKIYKYNDLPRMVTVALREHIQMGQYKKGAKVTVIAQADLDESAKKLVERYLGSSQTMFVEKLLTEGILDYEDIQNYEIYPEWYGEFKGEKLSFPGGSYQEREDFSSKFDDLIEKYPDSEEEINTLKKEFESATEESKQQEVFEWIPVQDDWFKEQLVAKGVPVLESEEYNTTWWGRTTFGQMWMADSVIQNIAKEMLSSRKTGGYAGYREGAEVRYQGYKNYPTHNIKLWIDNDESSQSHWNERAEEIWKEAKKDKILSKRDNAIYTLQEELKAHFNDENPLTDASTYTDILQHGLDSVEWREVAIALLSEKIKWNGGSMATGGGIGKKRDAVIAYAIDNMDNLEDWGVPKNLLVDKIGNREKIAKILEKEFDDNYIVTKYDDISKSNGESEMKQGGKLPEKGTPEWHQIQIAKQTVKMPAAMAGVMDNSPGAGEEKIANAKKLLDKYGIKYGEGGSAEGEREFEYIKIKPVEGGIELSLTAEGKEKAQELMKENKVDVFILPDLFDDVQGNSGYIFHSNLGESGLAMTSAPGITDGYYPSEHVAGEWETPDSSAKLYYFNDYATNDMIEEMLDEGKVILIEAKDSGGKMKKGGKADVTPNYYRFRQHSPKGVTECAVPSWGNKVAESVKKGAKVTTCKKDGKWFLQSIMIPKNGVKTSEAKKYANEIKDKFTRKKKALGGQAGTCTCEEIHSLVDGFKIMRDNATSDEEKQKYEQLISDLS